MRDFNKHLFGVSAPSTSLDITQDKLLSIEQICEALGVSRRTLETKRNEGKFPKESTYIFNSPRWTAKTLNDWLNAQERNE